MSILFGHPTGNPNSHHAALAHYEAGLLEAFCVPWMPSTTTLNVLCHLPLLAPMAQRLTRRHFQPLDLAPKIQGRLGEATRLIKRTVGLGNEGLSYEANDWLMRTMRRECHRSAVTAVHAYEDCSLWQFEEAKRLGKACIYDMPIGYYPAWEQTQAELVKNYADWLPERGLLSSRYVRPDQKRREMELADLVLVPSTFVEKSIRLFHPYKNLAHAAYGVDLNFWRPPPAGNQDENKLRFIYAGQISIRKGIPLLLAAWEKAALSNAELELVGIWMLAENKRSALPQGVIHTPPCSREALRDRYHSSDVFVFTSFFEGFGLVLLEAMACGLPAIASDATAGPDVLTEDCGRIIPTGSVEAIVEGLRWFASHRDQLPALSCAARTRAEGATWQAYRHAVSAAISPLI